MSKQADRRNRARPGPKPKDGKHRVRLCSSPPIVSQGTRTVLNAWRTAYGVPMGRIIDSMTAYLTKQDQFKFRLSLVGKRDLRMKD